MVKAKKGKHGGKEDDSNDENDVVSVESGNSKKRKDSEGSIGKKDKKSHKGKKKGDDDSEDEEILEKKSKKGKKKNVESDNEEIVDKKSKKGKKKNDDSDDEEEVKASKKKSKKDKKKVEDEDDEEISNLTKKVEAVDISKSKKKKGKNRDDDSENDLSDDEVPKKAKGKAKEKPKGGFALLQVEDENSDIEIAPSPERPDTPEETYDKPKPGQDKGGKKGKKNRKKKDDDDDDDIDKVLAELEMEYSGVKPKDDGKKDGEQNEEKAAKKPKKVGKGNKKGGDRFDEDLLDDVDLDIEDEEEEKVVKSAAQKKKEKKLRQLQKKEEKRDASVDSKPEEKPTEELQAEPKSKEGEDDKKSKKDRKKKGDKEKDKDKDKKKEEEDKDDKKAKGPGKKALAAMQEHLRKLKEEEERMKREEEERIRREEEAENARLEALRLEKEKKEKKKQKEKERKERLKAEGKLLTAKQKADKARAEEMIAALRAQGVQLPDPREKKPRPGTRIRTNKSKTLVTQDSTDGKEQKTEKSEKVSPPPEVQVEIIDTKEEPKEEVEGIKDTWDAESSDGEDASEKAEPEQEPEVAMKPEEKEEARKESEDESESEEEDDDDEDDEDEEEESSEEESGSEDEHKTDAEKKREKALARIEKRKEEAEKNKSLDNLRAAVVCVLGHVDTGKTKILDKLRNTHVQDGEAGGITQQIGATNVPIDNIKEACKLVKSFNDMELKIPGLLIIDTPGHESFSNLRSRGSSLCDIAILVVDIMHGLEPQTIESINLLKTKKTPFVVALNKIDRLYDWKTGGKKDIRDIMKSQSSDTLTEFNRRTKEVCVQFAEQGLNAALFFENPDLRSYVSLVPTSAITGEGMGNLLGLIVEFCQNMLAKRLMYSDLLLATVLEVKAISGLGTTIDCILINGKLAEGDTIILAGTDGPIVTQIRSLLMPQPMKELRVKNAYIEYKEVKAAQGVKIAAKDLEKAIAGLNLQVAQKPDEVPIYCEEVAKELKTALSSIKLKERGVYVQASTLGSLEALLEFLRTSKIPYSGIRIGPVVKKDVMKASIMLEHESQYATILAFDVKVERDAQELADSLGVKIFQANIIYHLFDKFMAYREELKQKKRDEFKNIAVFPCKLRILPQFVFNSRDPIVVGVMVEAGIVKEGTPLCVPSKEFLNVGIVTSVEVNHKPIEAARKGQEVCLKIENPPGETPKLYGRHFDHTDLLMSRISRQSIDACKDYFRDDLTKQDWQLMVELKKLFQIL